VRSSPTVADGTVYVGSDNNSVYALDASDGADSEGSRSLLGTLGHNDLFTADGSLSSGETLSGTVTDADGDAIENANVEAVNASTEATATTDTSGAYEMTVESGDYDVTASKPGYSPTTKSVTIAGATTVNFTLISGTTITSPDPPDGGTVTASPVDISVLANSTNQSVQSISVEFYQQTNNSIDPANDTKIGSATVAPGDRATATWDPGPGTYNWYVQATADDSGETVSSAYALGIGDAYIVDGSEQPADGAIVRPGGDVDLAVGVEIQDNATVSFYKYGTGNPANDRLIGTDELASSGTATTQWHSENRTSAEEWYVILSDSTGTRDTAGAFEFGPGGEIVARDAETGAVIDDRPVRFEATYPSGSDSFDRAPARLNLSRLNSEPGNRVRFDVKAKDYYLRTVEVSSKQTNLDVYLERGGNWSYNPSDDNSENYTRVSEDESRFVSRFILDDQTGKYPPGNTTLTLLADLDGDGTAEIVHKETFGVVNRVDAWVEEGRRYQLKVSNDEGDTRGLGGWTATQAETIELTIKNDPSNLETGLGYAVDARINENDNLEIQYRDYETNAEQLDLTIREHPDGPILENRSLSDVENATITIALNESQAEKVWEVEYSGSRVGVDRSEISGEAITSERERIPIPAGESLIFGGAMLILAVIAALFTGPLAAVGGVVMVAVGAVMYFIGWLPVSPLALWVAGIIAIGGGLKSGGGRLG